MKAGEEYQVLGIRFAKSKDGKDNAVLYYATPFEDWEVSGSIKVEGVKVDREFTMDPNVIEKFKTLKLNDVVSFSYRKGFQGSAVIAGVTVVKSSGK